MKTELFANMTRREFDASIEYINAGEFFYSRNQIIFSAGDVIDKIGLVTGGKVIIESNDLFGNNIVLGLAKEGELFGEVYAILGEPLLVDVRAKQDCIVLFLKVNNLPASRSWSLKLTDNLLRITARKNLYLSQRSFINANRTIRKKVMSYLNYISLTEGSKSFEIPFDRQQMADYLNIDRSALSKELSDMKKEGIIYFRKNHFTINTDEVIV
ncbi:MAG: Crp/Fnr family transcriptional regulator [Synergistaceae bacterium]|nr:Crp/Fnr family transcriptional regulator [Synergistaceae bacterium]